MRRWGHRLRGRAGNKCLSQVLKLAAAALRCRGISGLLIRRRAPCQAEAGTGGPSAARRARSNRAGETRCHGWTPQPPSGRDPFARGHTRTICLPAGCHTSGSPRRCLRQSHLLVVGSPVGQTWGKWASSDVSGAAIKQSSFPGLRVTGRPRPPAVCKGRAPRPPSLGTCTCSHALRGV